MKKFHQILLALALPILAFAFASCNDDDDLPNVDISLELAQGTVVDGTIYVAQGDTIEIASIVVVNNEAGKGAGITNVSYYWDGYYYSPAVFAPFGMIFPTTEDTRLGKHSIDITCTVLAVDKSIATAAVSYPVEVVATAADIPTGPAQPAIVVNTKLKN